MSREWMPPNPLGDETDASGAMELLDFLHPAWHRQAACHGLTSLMFTDRGEPTEQAKDVCHSCPVEMVCREWVLSQPHDMFGIWGGMSQRERRRERRRRRVEAA